jgi:hypothetical protein
MKKLSTLLLFAVSVLAFSCNKGNETQTQPYAIDGVDDIYVRQGEADSWNLAIRSIGPVYEDVTLSITGLPQGLTATMSNSHGQPTFYSTVVFNNMSALPGSYPCVLTASSAEAGKSTYDFTIKIDAPIVCGLIQDFDATSACDSPYILNITTVNPPIEDSINTVNIFNISNSGATFQAQVDCSNNTISVPAQSGTFNGDFISITGSGTFDGNNVITLVYTITINGNPTSCTATFSPR